MLDKAVDSRQSELLFFLKQRRVLFLDGIQLGNLGGDFSLGCRFRQPQIQGDGLVFHFFWFLFVIIIQKRQRAISVPAEGYSFSVFMKHEGIIIGTDISNAYLK